MEALIFARPAREEVPALPLYHQRHHQPHTTLSAPPVWPLVLGGACVLLPPRRLLGQVLVACCALGGLKRLPFLPRPSPSPA